MLQSTTDSLMLVIAAKAITFSNKWPTLSICVCVFHNRADWFKVSLLIDNSKLQWAAHLSDRFSKRLPHNNQILSGTSISKCNWLKDNIRETTAPLKLQHSVHINTLIETPPSNHYKYRQKMITPLRHSLRRIGSSRISRCKLPQRFKKIPCHIRSS